MDDGFVAAPLRRRQVDQAFPLVRAIAPELGVERWRAFANAIIIEPAGVVAPSGIMTVQNTQGYIHGLFSYTMDDHLRHGRVLSVNNFIVLDLFDVAAAAGALLKAMDATARSLSCAAIHTNLPEQYATLPDACDAVLNYFRDDGHAVETLRLFKPLDGANDNRSHPLSGANDAD